METRAYQDLQEGESSWWYQARIAFLRRMLSGMSLPKGRGLDFGAGFGGMCGFMSTLCTPDAFEIHPEAVASCKKRGYAKVITGHDDLIREPAYDIIGAFDVIEHIEDDASVARMLYDRLRPDGVLLVTVPAFSCLWSKHDEENHHFRRYTLPEITRLLTDAGFVDVRATYWNMLLFPVAFVLRLIGRGGGSALAPARPVNWMLTQILKFESLAVPYTSLPFGVSIVIVGRKPSGASAMSSPEVKPHTPWGIVFHPVYLFSLLCNSRLIHFLSVGSAGAILNLFLTWSFTEFVFGQERYLDAFIIGIAGNLIFNFAFNTLITFKTKTRHARRFAGFVAYSLSMAGIQYYTVKSITPLVGIDWYLLVIAGVILAYAFLNFLFFKHVLFQEAS